MEEGGKMDLRDDFDEYEVDENDDENDYNTNELADPHRAKKYKRWIKGLLIIFCVLIVVLSSVVICYAIYIKNKYDKILIGSKSGVAENAKNLLVAKKLRGEDSGDVNILFIGRRNSNMEGKYLSSAMLLINFDVKQNKMNLISIPRDLWVPIDGGYGKANSIYKTAVESPEKYPDSGLPFSKKKFSDILGINIDYIITSDFDSFEKIINRIGKVNIKMPDSEIANYPFLQFDQFKSSRDNKNKNLYHLDGPSSFIFISWPKDAIPDFDRLRRMQLFVFSFVEQYVSSSLILNWDRTNDVLDIAKDGIRTDIQIWELKKLIDINENIPSGNIQQHKLTTDQSSDGGLLKETDYFGTSYCPIPGDSDFSQIHSWAEKIIAN